MNYILYDLPFLDYLKKKRILSNCLSDVVKTLCDKNYPSFFFLLFHLIHIYIWYKIFLFNHLIKKLIVVVIYFC